MGFVGMIGYPLLFAVGVIPIMLWALSLESLVRRIRQRATEGSGRGLVGGEIARLEIQNRLLGSQGLREMGGWLGWNQRKRVAFAATMIGLPVVSGATAVVVYALR